MLSYIALGFVALIVAFLVNKYRQFNRNLALAKQSGIPYIVSPIYSLNTFWLVTHKIWLPWLRRLPSRYREPWLRLVVPDFAWNEGYDTFRELNSDAFIVVSPDANTFYVADPDAIAQITVRRNDFPKPTWMYGSVDLFGKNVVSTEGSIWRHHRKITSPPFTEKNNHLVFQESLHQAESMVAGWLGARSATGAVWDVAEQTMRLSLHVISRAGFGVRLNWPHEESAKVVPPGHTLTYKEAIETLLHNIVVVMLSPSWMLKFSPFKFHKVAGEALSEWSKYMHEMYDDKRREVQQGESRTGMDLMGALIKGAGITAESLNAGDNEKGGANKQLLTDGEIIGNAFVFILAGHETAANTIHFALVFLAMHVASQRHLQKDLDAIFGSRPVSEWDYDEDVPKLFGSMCGAVMNEELRLIPPVIGIPKCVPKGRPQGLQLGDRNVSVPEGCYVTLNTVALHRHPRYWPHTDAEDLLSFRPERWLLDPSSSSSKSTMDDAQSSATDEPLDFDGPDQRPDTAPSLFRPRKGVYIPFSDGYRSCLGRRFAQVEILAVLAVVFKTHSVELDVSMFLSDAEFEKASEAQKREAWTKAYDRAKDLFRNAMGSIITIQMRGGQIPIRFVKRGSERFAFL